MVCIQVQFLSVLTSYLCNAQRSRIRMFLDPLRAHVYTVMVERSIIF